MRIIDSGLGSAWSLEGIVSNGHQHGFRSGEVGLYLLFSCRRMFSAATKKKAICFQWQINYGFEFGGLENILTFDIFCCQHYSWFGRGIQPHFSYPQLNMACA